MTIYKKISNFIGNLSFYCLINSLIGLFMWIILSFSVILPPFIGFHSLEAFQLPDKKELREKILKEVDKIKGLSPVEKMRRQWLLRLKEADRHLKTLLSVRGDVYTKDSIEESDKLIAMSKKYGSKREYRKAEYLARKAIETIKDAIDRAGSMFSNDTENRKAELIKIKKMIGNMPKIRLAALYDDIQLRLIILEEAISAQDFEAFDENKKALYNMIKSIEK